jgi:SpoVK/Ycf46/Vps4 family AAA+-type ATPase
MVFTGNPGTGKTTIARILAEVFHAIGLLPTPHLVEVSRVDLVGETVGSTAPKVENACNRAMGGVLFVDEAYALVSGGRGSSNDFGQEAIDTLLKRMSDDEGKFVVIAAGYAREMRALIDSNSGLSSRFSAFVDFADYDGEQLTRIFEIFAHKQGYRVAPEARAELLERLGALYRGRDANFGNARTVKRLFESVEARLSARVLRLKREGMALEALREAANLIALEDLGPRGEGAWA